MTPDGRDKRGSSRSDSARPTTAGEGTRTRGEDLSCAAYADGEAAHARAVMTVKLTLLLLLAGTILFLFDAAGRPHTAAQGSDRHVEQGK